MAPGEIKVGSQAIRRESDLNAAPSQVCGPCSSFPCKKVRPATATLCDMRHIGHATHNPWRQDSVSHAAGFVTVGGVGGLGFTCLN